MKALIAAIALAASSAHALTGNELHDAMQSSDPVTRAFAVAYITGLSDGLSFAQYSAQQNNAKLGPPSICVPNGTVQQTYDVVKKFLVENPARRHHDAGVVATYALAQVWPCK